MRPQPQPQQQQQQQQPHSALLDAVCFIAAQTDFRFPDATAHALRRAAKATRDCVPRPELLFDRAMREQSDGGGGGGDDPALIQFVQEACAARPDVRRKFLRSAARHGCAPVCRAIADAHPDCRKFDACGEAAAHGQKAFIAWARSYGFPWGSACRRAAEAGDLPLVQWLHARRAGGGAGEGIVNGAAAGGHEAVLQWALASGCGVPADAPTWAARSGDLALLRRVAALVPPGPEQMADIAWVAASGGHLPVLQWAAEGGGGRAADKRRFEAACQNGHTHVLQWMLGEGGEALPAQWGSGGFAGAALRGRTEVVRWLLDAGFEVPPGSQITASVVRRGDPEMLRFLHANGFPFCARTCAREAASRGDPEVLRFLRDSGLAPARA